MYIRSMRHMWIVGLAVLVCFGAACSSSPSPKSATTTTVKHRHHHRTTTTTTTTTAPSTTGSTVASGVNDKTACMTFMSIGSDAHKSRKVIATDFRRLFKELHQAESTNIKDEGHRAAKALLTDKVKAFKKAFFDLDLLCTQIGVT
jgi:hypothetical protein